MIFVHTLVIMLLWVGIVTGLISVRADENFILFTVISASCLSIAVPILFYS